MISVFNPVPFLYDETVRIITAIPNPVFTLDHIEKESYRLFFTTNSENEEELCDLVRFSLMRANPTFRAVVLNVEVEETSTRVKHNIPLIKV